MSGAVHVPTQWVGRGEQRHCSSSWGCNALLLPKYMLQIAPNTKQPFCLLSASQTEEEIIESGCSCSVCWWSCPPHCSRPWLCGASIPIHFQCRPWEQGPASLSFLPTLLWAQRPTCKHHTSFSSDSLLVCPNGIVLFLSVLLSYFH